MNDCDAIIIGSRCADCGTVTAPVVPGACLPRTQFTAAFVAHLLNSKYTLHLALERIRGELARQGYPMASAFLGGLFVASAPFEVVVGTLRASFSVYNTAGDVERLATALRALPSQL